MATDLPEPHLTAPSIGVKRRSFRVRSTRRVGSNGDVGIWHETYVVKQGGYETVYNNMPPHGLGRAGKLVDAVGGRQVARTRMKAGLAA